MYFKRAFDTGTGSSVARNFNWRASSPFPSLSLEVEPAKIQLDGLGTVVSSTSGVWGGAPAELEFGAF